MMRVSASRSYARGTSFETDMGKHTWKPQTTLNNMSVSCFLGTPPSQSMMCFSLVSLYSHPTLGCRSQRGATHMRRILLLDLPGFEADRYLEALCGFHRFFFACVGPFLESGRTLSKFRGGGSTDSPPPSRFLDGSCGSGAEAMPEPQPAGGGFWRSLPLSFFFFFFFFFFFPAHRLRK